MAVERGSEAVDEANLIVIGSIGHPREAGVFIGITAEDVI